jgi:hypothetical protein
MLNPYQHPVWSRKLRPDFDRDPYDRPYQWDKEEDQMGDEDHVENVPGERQHH